MTGFIVMQRDALDHPLLKDGERFRAWFWMLARAAWKPTPFDIGGKMVTLQRGQLCGSVRQFADAWGMSKSAVDRFLSRLKSETMIETETGQGRLIITICNYAKYQDVEKDERDSSGTATGTPPGQQRDIKEQGNQGTIEDEETNVSPSSARAKADKFPLPDGVDPIDWEALKANRKAKRAALSEGAHRQIVTKLAGWARDGWPPGPIVANAAERGWTSVFETDEMKAASNGRHGNNRNGAPGHHGGRDNRDGFQRALDRRIFGDGEAGRPDAGEDGGFGELPLASAAPVQR